MENSIQLITSKMEVLYENIFALMQGFQTASTTQNSEVKVSLKNPDTLEVTTQTINSFQRILHELTRIDNNFKSLINVDNISYIVNADGSLAQVQKSTFLNAEYLKNFTFPNGDVCVVENSSFVEDLMFPIVKLPIAIDSTIKTNIFTKIFEINDGWDYISDSPTILELEYLLSNGKIAYKEVDRELSLNKTQVKYYGVFDIVSITQSQTNANIFTVVLNTTRYSGLNSLSTSFELNQNDILVSNTGASKYVITDIDKFTNTAIITRVAGSEIPTTGTSKLSFNETLSNSETNVVNVPIKPQQKIVVFLSTVNLKAISFPSQGIKIDTSTYNVSYKNSVITLDDFFANYVLNFSDYLTALINDTSIPFSLGITPTKPVLKNENFKILQINRHLTSSKSITEIADLNRRKQAAQNEIDYKQALIDTTQKELSSQKYSTNAEKESKLSSIKLLNEDIATLKTNILNISREIDTNAIKNGLKTATPKYRVIGFWEVQKPIYSPKTKAQHIIRYDVQYRYLSKDTDTIDATSYEMIDENGKKITVTFSPWNDYQSKTLTKVLGIDGETLEWETQILDSSDEVNINQLAVTISEGESVEVRVRAISEAGYPLSPKKSEWSEIIRVDFPLELKQNDVSTTVSQNATDLAKAEFDKILKDYGIIEHISTSIKEGEKKYYHVPSDIASGQYTTEQKIIPLDSCLVDIIKRLNVLEKTDISSNVSIQLIDFNSDTFVVKNNTTMDIFAGNYIDSNALLDSTQWGKIIRKQATIKIKNTNAVPIEIRTLIPRSLDFNQTNAPTYYNTPISGKNKFLQDSGQIIYFRNTDVTGNVNGDTFSLVVPKKTLPNFAPNPIYLQSTSDAEKDLVFYNNDGSTVSIGKLTEDYDSHFVAFSKEHPNYSLGDYQTNPTLKTELERLKLYTDNLKANQYQQEAAITDTQGICGFSDNDFYAVGYTTTGAFLYPLLTNISQFQVVGNTTVSTLVIPKESEISIPVIFEFRMIDRFGNIDGDANFDTTQDLTYSKKIGIDLFLNNELFKFDVSVSCRLKSKITLTDSANLTSVVSSFNNNTQELPS